MTEDEVTERAHSGKIGLWLSLFVLSQGTSKRNIEGLDISQQLAVILFEWWSYFGTYFPLSVVSIVEKNMCIVSRFIPFKFFELCIAPQIKLSEICNKTELV